MWRQKVDLLLWEEALTQSHICQHMRLACIASGKRRELMAR
jgi:hypothetical protein